MLGHTWVMEVNGYKIGPGENLHKALLYEADLSDTDLTEANLFDANLT